nr:GerMN domain-containing protein [Nocardioides agariphilus]
MVVGGFVAALLLTGCGLPGGGAVRRVDEDTVPYRLLESDATPPTASGDVDALGRAPVVYWLDGDRLVPEATTGSCSQRPEVLVEELVVALAGGPSDEARASGRSSAIPSGTRLAVVGVEGGTVSVDIDDGTAISAERLPAAIGQVALTLTSAPGIESVLVVSNGQSVQVPLPGGALTDRPVTGEDYAELLPERFRGSGRPGCPRS